MKKRVYGVLIFCMAILLAVQSVGFAVDVVPAAVADGAAVNLSFTEALYNGETAKVRLTLTGVTDEKIGLFQLYLKYDPKQMDYQSGDFAPVFGSGKKIVEPVVDKPGHILLLFDGEELSQAVPASEGMTIAELNFKVKELPGRRVNLSQPQDESLQLGVYKAADYTQELPEMMKVTLKETSALVGEGVYAMSDPQLKSEGSKLIGASVEISVTNTAQAALCVAAVCEADEEGDFLVAPLQIKSIDRTGKAEFTFSGIAKTEKTRVKFMLWDSLQGALKPLCPAQIVQ